MNPEQALQLLDQLVAGIALSRAQHGQVSTAVAVLRQAIKPAE